MGIWRQPCMLEYGLTTMKTHFEVITEYLKKDSLSILKSRPAGLLLILIILNSLPLSYTFYPLAHTTLQKCFSPNPLKIAFSRSPSPMFHSTLSILDLFRLPRLSPLCVPNPGLYAPPHEQAFTVRLPDGAASRDV